MYYFSLLRKIFIDLLRKVLSVILFFKVSVYLFRSLGNIYTHPAPKFFWSILSTIDVSDVHDVILTTSGWEKKTNKEQTQKTALKKKGSQKRRREAYPRCCQYYIMYIGHINCWQNRPEEFRCRTFEQIDRMFAQFF
jgi:hypothetical protein